MALVRKAAQAKPETESNPTEPTTPSATPAPAPAPAEAKSQDAPPAPPPPAAPSKQTGLQVQVPRSTALANLSAGHDFWNGLRDALPVNWDTLNRLKANQGRISWEKKNLGDWIEFRVLSYQANFLVSPGGDSDEAKAMARYSDDGKTLKDDGRDIHEYVAELKASGFPEARIGERMVLVLELVDCDKDVEGVEDGTLFQIDLPPTSRGAFNRYKIQSALDLSKGKTDGDTAVLVRATAEVKSANNKEWTQLEFSRAKYVPPAQA